MSTELLNCIYCEQAFNPLAGQGDHVLPCGLFGEFEGAPTFRGTCVACNNGFSHFEQLLAQGTPLGFYRRVAQPNRGKRKGRGLGHMQGTRGAKQPRFTTRFRDCTILVLPSTEDPLEVSVPDQIVVRDQGDEDYPIVLFPHMGTEGLRKQVQHLRAKRVQARLRARISAAKFWKLAS